MLSYRFSIGHYESSVISNSDLPFTIGFFALLFISPGSPKKRNSNTTLSVSLHFINNKKVENTETRLTFSRRKLTTCAWFRLAAIWSGVLPLQSTRVILQTAGSLLTKCWTIGIAPCSHAMWNAVCLSSLWGIMDTKRHNEMYLGQRTCPYNALFYLS